MFSDESSHIGGARTPESEEELPPIEDAQEVKPDYQGEVGEDDAELLAPSSRTLETDDCAGEQEQEQGASSSPPALVEQDGSSDADAIPDDVESEKTEATKSERPGLDPALSPYRVGAELKRIEREVRTLLESRDPRRKRKLGGTRRWLELEDDLRRWRFMDRFDVVTLDQLGCLVARRHYLFQRLRFLAGTRLVWNS